MEFKQEELIEIVNKASTIAERLSSEFIFDDSPMDNEIVVSRLEQWCQVVARGEKEKFEKRLAWDGLDLRSIRPILGAVRLRNDRNLPEWAETLNEVMKASNYIYLETLEQHANKEDLKVDFQQLIPFEEVFLPFIDFARQQLIAQTNSNYHLLSNNAHHSLERNLLGRLSRLCSPTLELEFSIFRACHQSTVSRLINHSRNKSRIHYLNFIKSILSGGLQSLFKKYPVLARLAATVVNLWIDSSKEFLLRLESDQFTIEKTFSINKDLGQVVAIQPNLSDHHNNGRSVMIVRFASGLKLVYKPKDLGLEEAYFRLLDWLNKKGELLQFKLLKVINRSTYGWVEYAEHLPCRDEQEARLYYHRYGMILCLVYLLEGIDFHNENLIACAEHPVLVDLETLLHHRQIAEIPIEFQDYSYLAYEQLGNSIVSNGLLPRWEFNLEGRSYDPSALGSVSEQETMVKLPKWNHINTDDMALTYDYGKHRPGANTPFLNERNLSSSDYVENLIEGFQKMYHFLITHRNALQSVDGPLIEFSHQQVRFIFRMTRTYAFLILKTIHPQFLRDGADRSIQLDILSSTLLLSDDKHPFWPVLQTEYKALEQLDIPLFTALSDSDALTITPNAIIEKCFKQPSYNSVIYRLNQINNEGLEQQIDFLRGSVYSQITTNEVHCSSKVDINSILNHNEIVKLTKKEILHQVIEIAVKLKKQAIDLTGSSTTWIAPQYIRLAHKFQLQPMGYSLYDGSCGVALFLAELQKVTEGAAEFRNLALAALQPLNQMLQEDISEQIVDRIGIGGLMGCGSIIYVLVTINQFLDKPVLLGSARKVASLIKSNLIASDKKFEIFSGIASTILGLLALHNVSADSEVLEKAVSCGNHLLNNRVTSESGYRTWATLDGKLLTGFSHGAAGIAYALLRLYSASGETTFLEAAEEAIAYERSVFIPEQGNWPDFRQLFPKDKPVCMCSWCHGATGIGLARLGGLDVLDTPEIRQDIEAAINTTKQQKLTSIDHLCCGNMGRVEFLLTASRKLSRPELLEDAMQIASQVVARAKQKGHFGYGPILTFHPGFFQGSAGIGYELLRLAYPDQLPSVLLWE